MQGPRAGQGWIQGGGEFWAADYWDTFMRDSDHEVQARNYAENNPVKARLISIAKNWRWSSARLRDPYEKLVYREREPSLARSAWD